MIAFDQIVSADCAYTMESDWNRAPRVEAEWIAKKLGGKGKVFVDRGLAGAPISDQLQSGFESVIKKYPGIEIVGYFNGNYALGPEQAGVADLWPRSLKSTLSSCRAMAPVRSRRCRMPVVRSFR